jgi:hypothetical protein
MAVQEGLNDRPQVTRVQQRDWARRVGDGRQRKGGKENVAHAREAPLYKMVKQKSKGEKSDLRKKKRHG